MNQSIQLSIGRFAALAVALWSVACEECTSTTVHTVGDPRLSLLSADGAPTDRAVPGVQLLIEGEAGDCVTPGASLSCEVGIGEDNRLEFTLSGEACSGLGEDSPTVCALPSVQCQTPPLAAGRYILPYRSNQRVEGEYTFEVSDAGAAVEAMPRPAR
jgi:hypothetical protein